MASGTYRAPTLFTEKGARKYLSLSERTRFYEALSCLSDPTARTYCEMIFWSGCRPSEALALSALSIDLDEGAVVIRSLKKRGDLKDRHFRSVPLPSEFLENLDRLHSVRRAQGSADGGENARLWGFGRTTAWRRMRDVMKAAELTGAKACAKGLRHSYGVTAALSFVPETRIKAWLGHASLSTTEIYLEMAGPEDRAMAARMWNVGGGDAGL